VDGQRRRQKLTPQPSRAAAQTSAASPAGSELARQILECLDEHKAEDLVSIDLKGKSSLADMMIIASGRSDRHVGAIAEHVVERLKELGLKGVHVEGLPKCDWVLIDAGDVIVHLFRPEVRAFYRLERLWTEEAPQVGRPN
jgi:ribosome-associated protein